MQYKRDKAGAGRTQNRKSKDISQKAKGHYNKCILGVMIFCGTKQKVKNEELYINNIYYKKYNERYFEMIYKGKRKERTIVYIFEEPNGSTMKFTKTNLNNIYIKL